MPKLSELIAEGKEIRFSNGKQKNILMKKTKNGWTTQKDDASNKVNKGTSKSVILKEEPMRYIKKLYASQYKIVSPSGVQIDW
ncbi:MAG: hypothetical protein LBV13_01980 [Methanomassiliicoccaceae archaeon]|jgi:hypothetical protein|nr:hypothetical protein [Methanomassiliicoccaceae archaeon]